MLSLTRKARVFVASALALAAALAFTYTIVAIQMREAGGDNESTGGPSRAEKHAILAALRPDTAPLPDEQKKVMRAVGNSSPQSLSDEQKLRILESLQ